MQRSARPDGGLAPVLVALFVLAMLVLGVTQVAARLATPWDGMRWMQDAMRADPIIGALSFQYVSGTPHSATDRITAIESISVSEARRGPFDVRPLPATGVLRYDVTGGGLSGVVRQPLVPFDARLLLNDWPALLLTGTWLALGLLVFRRRPRDSAAQVMVIMGAALLPNTFWAWVGISDYYAGPVMAVNAIAQPAYFLGLMAAVAFALVYPRPLPLVQRHQRLAMAICAAPALVAGAILIDAQLESLSLLAWWPRVAAIEALAYVCAGVGIAVILPLRYRSLHDALERRRLLLIVGSLAAATAGVFILWLGPVALWGRALLPPSLIALIGLPIPIGLAVAILRYNAFDLKLALGRSLVYGGATVLIALLYVGLVGAAILLVHERFGFAIALLAAGLMILIAQPIRDGMQRAVNRLLYGDRDSPYRGLRRLQQRLQAALPAEQALPVVVETIASSLRLPYVAIELDDGDGRRVVAQRGEAASNAVAVPLVHRSELVGRLHVVPRVGEDELSELDRNSLDALATQVASAIKNMQLDDELRQSRDRLVLTREEERRRLGRELHDGVAPTLAGNLLQLRAARVALAKDPTQTGELLTKLEQDTRQAIVEVRRLARELRPPALDALGLVGAVRERAADFSADPNLDIEVAVSELPPLSAAVEVAAYRIVLEALANVASHAHARHCSVRLMAADDLVVSITDDGGGLPPDRRAGVGLRSMRERAAELGGSLEITSADGHGTTVEARLPLRAPASA